LRGDHAPVYRNDELDFYALSRYSDVLEASLDHRTYSSAKGTTLELDPELIDLLPMIIFMDPPRQTRIRRLVSPAFTPRRIAALEPTIRSLAARFLIPIVQKGSCDFVREFAALLPIEVISTLIQYPGLIPNAVEEILRYWPPSQYQGRSLTREVKLHGHTLPRDARVLLLTGSACRDEREYRDADVFEVEEDKLERVHMSNVHGFAGVPMHFAG